MAGVPGRPLTDDSGRVTAVLGTAVDITERKRIESERSQLLEREQRARNDAAFLAEASRVLYASLDERRTLEGLAELAVGYLADWCTINLVSRSGRVRRVAGRHADPERQPLVDELVGRFPHDPSANSGVARVLRSGEPLLLSEVGGDLLAATAHDEEYHRLTRALGVRSCMVVPLRTRGRPFGAISLVSSESGRMYGSEDLALATELAARAASAVENARLYREREEVAEVLQRGLVPSEPPRVPFAEVASYYRPLGSATAVGGDFYDVFRTPDGA